MELVEAARVCVEIFGWLTLGGLLGLVADSAVKKVMKMKKTAERNKRILRERAM